MKKLNATNLRTIDFSQAEILSKTDLKSLKGGGAFLCTCSNEDGTSTIVGEAASADGCVTLCKKHWDKSTELSQW